MTQIQKMGIVGRPVHMNRGLVIDELEPDDISQLHPEGHLEPLELSSPVVESS
jgi:hypothetical protein